MMKRMISLALVVLMVAALFVGCGSSPTGPEGVYRIKTMDGKTVKEALAEQMGGEMSDEQLDAVLEQLGIDSLDDFAVFTLDADGKLTMSMAGNVQEGTWKMDGSKLILTVNDEDTEATYINGEITVEKDGQELVLAK